MKYEIQKNKTKTVLFIRNGEKNIRIIIKYPDRRNGWFCSIRLATFFMYSYTQFKAGKNEENPPTVLRVAYYWLEEKKIHFPGTT